MGQTRFSLAHGLLVALAVAVIGAGVFWRIFGEPRGATPSIPQLEKQAENAIAAVKARRPGDRRPASYDDIIRPIGGLLAAARAHMVVGEQDAAEQISLRVLDLSKRALEMARAETSWMSSQREYSFPTFIAEASEYIATVGWLRLQRRRAQAGMRIGGDTPFTPEELAPLKRQVEEGLAADDSRAELWRLSGLLFQAEGMRVRAVEAFREATQKDPSLAAAWNDLGLALWDLQRFDEAERALDRAKAEAAKAPGGVHSEAYTTACFNLGRFHHSLFGFFAEEARNGVADAREKAARHATRAREELGTFLEREPRDSPDAQTARRLLDSLGE